MNSLYDLALEVVAENIQNSYAPQNYKVLPTHLQIDVLIKVQTWSMGIGFSRLVDESRL